MLVADEEERRRVARAMAGFFERRRGRKLWDYQRLCSCQGDLAEDWRYCPACGQRLRVLTRNDVDELFVALTYALDHDGAR